MRHGHDHVFALDEVFVLDLAHHLRDLGASGRTELLLEIGQLGLDDRDDPRARPQDFEIVRDLRAEPHQLVADFVAAERRQALQAKIQNRLGLLLGQFVRAFRRHFVPRIGDQLHQRRDVFRGPIALHQLRPRGCRVRCLADQRDDLVDIRDGDGEADQDVGPLARFAQQMLDPAPDDLLAEVGESADHVLEVQHLGPAAVQRHHVAAERALERREAIELIAHHVGHGLALQLDHDAHACAIAFVTNVGNAFDLLVAYELGDLLDHRGLVHLIRDLGDDERLPVLPHLFHVHAPAHDYRATAFVIGGADARAAENEATGRKVRTRNDFDQLVDLDRRIVEIGDAGVAHLAEIVRRNVRRHADGDAACSVDEKIGKFRGQNNRLSLASVIVGLEVDRVVFKVVEQRHRRLGQAHFGIAFGGRRVSVDGPEIALPVHERQTHGEVLREPDQRVVDRLIAVGMILAHRIAGHARRFVVRPVRRVVVLAHRIEDAPVNGLQAVSRIGQRTRHDHAHGVIEIGALHLVDERNRLDVGGGRPLDT